MSRRSILETTLSRPWFNFALFLIILIIYILTIYPGLGLIDSGELSAVSYTLGIAHPTGYPLYTLLGRLISLIPIGSIPFRINILSALFSSLGSLFLFLFISESIKSKAIALVPTAIVAFSHTIWSVSNVAEVYSLTYLLLTLCLYLYQKERYLLLSFFLGLSLTNHMIAISFVIPLIIFFFVKRRVNTTTILLFLLGLSLYLYLPIRASTHPLLNWGNPSTIERLYWHISGKQYRVWMFTLPFSEVIANLGNAFSRFANELVYVLIPLPIIGFYILRKKMTLYILILVINIGYSINYSIPDVESYFIPAFVVIGILAGYGLKKLKKPYLALLALLPLIHLPASSGSGYYFADDLAHNVLKNMKNDSFLICTIWDVYSPLLYYDVVEKKGSNHWIIDKELLRRSWYLDYIKHRYPTLKKECAEEFSQYERHLYLFEHDLRYDRIRIQQSFEALIRGMVLAGLKERPVYILAPIPDTDLNKALYDLESKPEGLLLRINSDIDTFNFADMTIRLPRELDQRHHFLVASIYIKAAYLNYQAHKLKSAGELFQKLTNKLK